MFVFEALFKQESERIQYGIVVGIKIRSYNPHLHDYTETFAKGQSQFHGIRRFHDAFN